MPIHKAQRVGVMLRAGRKNVEISAIDQSVFPFKRDAERGCAGGCCDRRPIAAIRQHRRNEARIKRGVNAWRHL